MNFHPSTNLEAFRISNEYLFVATYSYTRLVRPWYECSITRQCIAPDGTSRKNHRQDQSALTVLAALSGDRCAGVDSGISKQMDSHPRSYMVGVSTTHCYKDPLNIKWH